MPGVRDNNQLKKAMKAEINIEEIRKRSAPILVGTVSVDSSEQVSKLLKEKNISHQILNAKQHEMEAEVIANAGKPGMVTIATNMAGRGTDTVSYTHLTLPTKRIV